MQSFNPKFRGDDFLEQWDRVTRWYQKVCDIEANLYQREQIAIEEQEDYIYFFFLNVLNLKDWLKNTKKDPGLDKRFYSNGGEECLKICSDFVNNFKHFDNSKNIKQYRDTYFVSRDATSGGLGPTHTWWIQTNSGRVSAYLLAHECFNNVQIYLKEKKYL